MKPIKELEKQLSWDVVSRNVHVDGLGSERFKALIRSDNKEILSILSNSYVPFKNSEFYKLANSVAQVSGYKLKGFYELDKGRKILAFLHADQRVLLNDTIEEYLVLGNSHDGTRKLFVSTANMIHKCENMFSAGIKRFEAKHTKSVSYRQDELLSFVKLHTDGIKELYNVFERFKKHRINPNEIKFFVNKLLNLEKLKTPESIESNTRKQRLEFSLETELSRHGSNLWGLFNGLTHYTTHQLNNKHITIGSVTGTAENLNRLGFKICKEMLN